MVRLCLQGLGGFSGGPGFIQRLVTRDWRQRDLPLPEAWKRRAQDGGTDLATLGEVTTFTAWRGNVRRLGGSRRDRSCVSVEEILTFFESEMVEIMAKQRKGQWEDRKEPREVREARSGTEGEASGLERFEDLARKLFAVSKDELDQERKRER